MDFAYLQFQARRLPPDVSVVNTFYASVCTQIGWLAATPKHIVALRCLSLAGLFHEALLTLLNKETNKKEILPIAKTILNPYLEPSKYAKIGLAKKLGVSLRHIFPVSPGSIFNPEWLLEVAEQNYALDAKPSRKKLFILQVKGLGSRPLSKSHFSCLLIPPPPLLTHTQKNSLFYLLAYSQHCVPTVAATTLSSATAPSSSGT